MHLGISTLINILSSLAGSVLVLVTINLEFWVVPLMLALTVVIEAPMLKFFYRRQSLGWGKAWLISLVMNVIS